ncbi:MAG: hypothetical protein AB1629_04935 [Candidatus Omnitrophota bacterium]
MITAIRKRFQRLNTRAGQHLTEFLIMFLALAVAFIGMRLYLRRGVNAKLKMLEDQLNDAAEASGVKGAGFVFVKFKLYVELDDEWVSGCDNREFQITSEAFEGLKNGTYSRGYASECFIKICKPELATSQWYWSRIIGPDGYDTDMGRLVWDREGDYSHCQGEGFWG